MTVQAQVGWANNASPIHFRTLAENTNIPACISHAFFAQSHSFQSFSHSSGSTRLACLKMSYIRDDLCQK